MLHQGIRDYMSNTTLTLANNVPVLATVYYNKAGLQQILVSTGVCTNKQFEGFLLGFNQATPLCSMVDVGPGKEAADHKIKGISTLRAGVPLFTSSPENLKVYARLPQVQRVFLGVSHDNGYKTSLTALGVDRVLDKVVLIRGYEWVAAELHELQLSHVNWKGLFMAQKLTYVKPPSAPTQAGGPKGNSFTSPKAASVPIPQSPAASVSGSQTIRVAASTVESP